MCHHLCLVDEEEFLSSDRHKFLLEEVSNPMKKISTEVSQLGLRLQARQYSTQGSGSRDKKVGEGVKEQQRVIRLSQSQSPGLFPPGGGSCLVLA